MNENLLILLLEDFKGSFMDAPKELDKRLKTVMKRKWSVGFHDRGMGHGDFAVMVKFKGRDIVVIKCPCREIADHICKVHNEAADLPAH